MPTLPTLSINSVIKLLYTLAAVMLFVLGGWYQLDKRITAIEIKQKNDYEKVLYQLEHMNNFLRAAHPGVVVPPPKVSQ